MRTNTITEADLKGVFAVPPLARLAAGDRSIVWGENHRVISHILSGGISRLLYGGNAFLYHVTLEEYGALLDWLASFPDSIWCIPGAGPSFGRAMDQARLLRQYRFPTVMVLPCHDPRDAGGLERGLREFADAAGTPLMLYCKEETSFGVDKQAGLDAIGRLVECGVCIAIKYAVVRDDPHQDTYLEELLKRVDKARVVSGIGERPATVHMKQWGLPGFTTGSGCIAPHLSQALFDCCVAKDFESAGQIRRRFLPLEDFRDEKGPARVLHHATELAGIANTGAIPPYVSPLSPLELSKLEPIARDLVTRDGQFVSDVPLHTAARMKALSETVRRP
jgi:dihydrodipicolinate synthase/N-acetylneuraminate lyase